MTVYVIGFGNPGRFDDGLGPAFASAVARLGTEGVTVDADYQLTVEDAAAVAEHDVVLFADAAVTGPEPFTLARIRPKSAVSFSSHSVEPSVVVGLAGELFDARTPALLLAIRGYRFDGFGEGLSRRARSNLEAALSFVAPLLREHGLERLCAGLEEGAAWVEPNGADAARTQQ